MTQIITNLTSYSEHRPEDGIKDNWAAEYAKREVDKHRKAEVLDHPDGSVTDEKLSDGLRARISEAYETAQTASETANTAKDVAQSAKSSADIAVKESENAYEKSLAAHEKASTAENIANTAKNNSETAEQRATSAEAKADTAVAAAGSAVQKAETAQCSIETHSIDLSRHVSESERMEWNAALPKALSVEEQIDSHTSNADIHTTAEEKLVASEAYDLAREAKGIAISADSVAEKSLQYWQPDTTYRAGQVVYVTTYSGDCIYKCIAGHTSGDTFSETSNSVKVWQLVGEVMVGFSVRADVATRAEHDVDGDGIAKAAHLDLKADKPIITTSVDSVLSFEFSANHNTEIRTNEVTSLSFTFGNGEYAQDYTSGISFDSGETPTAIDYTDSGILNWVGTDCATSDGLSIFQPSANTHYDIVFYFNGAQFIGLVNGFIPSTGNEAV